MKNPKPGTGGDKYIPYDQRTGPESIVYFTRDLSEKGLEKIYDKVKEYRWKNCFKSSYRRTKRSKYNS